jgi:hypothetical protein
VTVRRMDADEIWNDARRSPRVLKRFWSHVDRGAGCWLWTGRLDRHGYGRFRFRGCETGAHRFSLELVSGAIGTLCACHRCDVHACVNPDHLFPATRRETQLDAMRRNGSVDGERTAPARLTAGQAGTIRFLVRAGLPTTSVARAFAVSPKHVGEISRLGGSHG